MMTPEQQQESIREALHHLMRGQGPGTIRRAQEALRRGESFFRDQRKRRSPIDLRLLFKALEFLNIFPQEFFAEALDSSRDPIDDLRRETDALGSEPPRLVTEALRRVDRAPVAPRRDAVYLQELDALRYTDARLAHDQAVAVLEHLPPDLLPRLLGVYGSALRLLEAHDGAQHALTAGLEMARAAGNRSMAGQLWQRFAYVVADRGNYRRALVISQRAEKIHVRAGDDLGIAKSLVEQGIWLHYLNQPHESIDLHRAALRRLPRAPQANRWRTSALQFLGLSSLQLEEIDQADSYAAQARDSSRGEGPWVSGGILWLQARIALSRESYAEAEGFLQEATEIFSPISSGQAALASIELIRCLILQDRADDAYETAKAVARLVEALRRKSRVAEAALAELVRCGFEGRGLTLHRLDDLAERISKSRARRSQRAQSEVTFSLVLGSMPRRFR